MQYVRSINQFMVAVAVSFLFSCSYSQKKEAGKIDQPSVEVIKAPEIVVTDSSFLALFPEISGDTIHIFSPVEKEGGSKFIGKRIVPEFYKYFLFDAHMKQSLDTINNIFSCYRIRLSDTRSGLIVRIPGQYSETAVNLFLWDHQSKKIIGNFELSDETGDGEWYFVKDAWLVDINKDNRLDILARRKDWWREDVDVGYGKEHVTDSVNVYIGLNDGFRKTIAKIDTTRFQLFNWKH